MRYQLISTWRQILDAARSMGVLVGDGPYAEALSRLEACLRDFLQNEELGSSEKSKGNAQRAEVAAILANLYAEGNSPATRRPEDVYALVRATASWLAPVKYRFVKGRPKPDHPRRPWWR